MDTEATEDYNCILQECVKMLYELRRLEFSHKSMGDKYADAWGLINDVWELLWNQHNFVLYKSLWMELHDRMAYYYPYLNKENLNAEIPLFRTVLHNDVMKWWVKCAEQHEIAPVIIHFDTHDDMGLPSNILLKSNGCLDKKKIRQGGCGKIDWPVTCLLLGKYVDQVIWAMPRWVYDDDAGFDQVLACEDDGSCVYLRSSDQKEDNFIMIDNVLENADELLDDPDQFLFFHPHRFDRLEVYGLRSWKKLIKKLNYNRFILDIDLDFFVTNGDEYSEESYKEFFHDLESTGRVHEFPSMITPRQIFDDDYSHEVIKKLNKEAKVIIKRVKNVFSWFGTDEGGGYKTLLY